MSAGKKNMKLFAIAHQRIILMARIGVIAVAMLGSPAFAADPLGDWLTKDAEAVIRIANCDEALCGTIAWVKTPGTDRNNPDPAKRDNDIVGVTILSNMTPIAENRWKGQVYNAKNGMNYRAYLILLEPNVLRIQGCVLGGLFCGGENWTRQTEPMPPPSPTIKQEGQAVPRGRPMSAG
jgi:uncharacterized protein (DUF2147 family)